jgi:hypothetical protein
MSVTIIERLEEAIRLLAAYEREIWPDQCEAFLGTVRDLQAMLAEIRTPSSFLEVAIQKVTVPAESPIDSSVLIQRMVDLEFAREKADDVRLALAAYQPYGRSKAMRYLQARKHLVGQLRRLVEAAVKVMQQIPEYTTSPAVRPDYLQVVPGNEAMEEQS